MLRIAIVEDEKTDSKRLESFILRYTEESGEKINISVFADGLMFLDESRKIEFDIILMDIEMPFIDGVEVAKKLRKLNTTSVLIFITNMVQYAVAGYEVEAMAFVVKPVKYADFKLKISKAIEKCNAQQKDTITLTSDYNYKRVAVRDIVYIESNKHSVIYHTQSEKIPVWNRAMSDIEKEMEKYSFARCNSGYLVNLQYVEKIEGVFVVTGGISLPISRGKRKQFLSALAAFGVV